MKIKLNKFTKTKLAKVRLEEIIIKQNSNIKKLTDEVNALKSQKALAEVADISWGLKSGEADRIAALWTRHFDWPGILENTEVTED